MQFLIIHMHGLGDMIMFVPAFNKLPKDKKLIDIIVFENNTISPILDSPKIRKVYYCDSSYFKFFFVLIKLLNQKYKNILFTNNSSPFKSCLISLLLKSQNIKIISEKKISFFSYRKMIVKVSNNLHKIYRNLLLVNSKIEKKNIDMTLHFQRINFNKSNQFSSKKINIGIHPGSNIKNGDKRWDPKKYLKLIEFYKKKNCIIHIFIGSYEKDLLNFYKSKSKQIKIIQKKSFNYVASLIEKLDLFISNETGLAHLSSSLGTKTIVIINKKTEKEKTNISIPIKNSKLIKKTRKNKDLIKIISLSKKILN